MVINYVVAVFCVLGLTAGQLLFKRSSTALGQPGLFSHALLLVASAMLIYAVTSLAWVWVLQRAELGKLYPVMALAFVFVPLASHYAFGETFRTQYVLGVALIILGIVTSVRA